MLKQIIIEDYSPQWAVGFEMLSAVYAKHLGCLIADIQHVGSTSVVGLAAKPIIDIDIIIDNTDKLSPVIAGLEALGYEYVGDLGIKEREAFRRSSPLVPKDGLPREWPQHNLYVCLRGSISLRNHLVLRDFLQANPEKVREYGNLKKQLVAEKPCDMEWYIKNKTPFIIQILADTGFEKTILDDIRKANGVL